MSNPFTKKICDKLGFVVYKEVIWNEFCADGKVVFPNIELPAGHIAYKRI